MNKAEKEKILNLFDRTIANCEFYEKEKQDMKLLNEIGCLRGIAYCLESVNICPYSDKFIYYINIQNHLIEKARMLNLLK